jgi:hypothetical protein
MVMSNDSVRLRHEKGETAGMFNTTRVNVKNLASIYRKSQNKQSKSMEKEARMLGVVAHTCNPSYWGG